MTRRSSLPDIPRVRGAGDRLVIAIDGPAASGKSSTADWVAERLGFVHVDSGALYRAVTATALRDNQKPETWTEPNVLGLARRVSNDIDGRSFTALIDGERADEELRGSGSTANVSRVAAMPGVRSWVNDQVRAVATKHDVVVDGRDIGTVVFPDADLKVFLVADPWERAKRRLVQRFGRHPEEAEIAEETGRLVHRDAQDATQTVQAKDAILIDTTYLTQTDQVERIVALAQAVLRRSGRPV